VQHTFTLSPRVVNTLEVGVSSDSSRNVSDPFPVLQLDSYSPMGSANPNARTVRNDFWIEHAIGTRLNKHSLRISTGWQHQQLHSFAPKYPAGSFRFTSGLTSLPGINNTGHAFASYLLGLSDLAEVSLVE